MRLPLYFVISFVLAVWHVIFCMIHLIWPIGTCFLTLVHFYFTCHAHGEKSSSRQLHFIPFLLSLLSCICQFVYFVKQLTHSTFLSLSALALFFLPFPKLSCFCLCTCWLFEISYFHWWFWASLQWCFLLGFVCDIEDCTLQGPPPPPHPTPSAVVGFILKF